VRRLFVVLCVLVVAVTAIAANAAVFNVDVKNMSTLTCKGPVTPSTSTSTTTTTTTVPPGGCATSTVCPSKADGHPHDNDLVCDGNNGNPGGPNP